MLQTSQSHSSTVFARQRRSLVKRRAFTIVELLVVVAIIILLVSLLIVAVGAATRTSQKTRTAALLDSIKKGLIRFKEDVGYFPPVLGTNDNTLRDLFVPPQPLSLAPTAAEINAVQQWWSSCALADFLIGYGFADHDGYGNESTESPAVGIRSPGYDGIWGATTPPGTGRLIDRKPKKTGKPLGPYLQLKDDRLLAGIAYINGLTQTYFAGDPLPAGLAWSEPTPVNTTLIPKVIVDYWGMPIRYYRRPYPIGAIAQGYRTGLSTVNPSTSEHTLLQIPTLSDVFLLRPQVIKSGSESPARLSDPEGGNVSTRDLDAAEFALVSTGPDKRFNQNITLHEDNVDNIIEVGP